MPAHWRTKRLKYAVDLINQKTDDADGLPYVGLEHIESWTGRRIESEAPVDPEGIANTFRAGDVLFGKLRPYLAKATHAREDGACTSEALVLRPRLVAPEYLLYYALNQAFVSVVDGSTYGSKMPRANWEFIGNLPCLLPPLPEQRTIAWWLDDRTRRIDELVAAKRRLIGLLVEHRTTLITHAVTKGLNPTAPRQSSGLDWLGDVPQHWEVKRLRFSLRSIEQGWSPQCETRQVDGDTEWGVLKVGCVNGTTFDESEHKALPAELDPLPEYEIKPGDVLMSRANTRELLGSAAYVHAVRPRLHLCDKLYRIRTNPRQIDPRFLVLSFRSSACRYQFEREADGASGSMKNIGQDTIKNVRMLLPPLPEQRAIVAHLDTVCAKLDALVAATETAISRLTEYRRSLISAAVTGKINVCGADCAVASVAQLAATLESPAAPTARVSARAAPVIAGRIAGERRGANKHFQRTVLAAQIIATIGDKPTFGRVKLQKAMVLAEYHLRIDEIQSEPVRAAAGPFDNQMMQSVHAQLKRSQWYAYDQARHGAKYGPLAKAGGHAEYFDRYWSDRRGGFGALMKTLDPMTTEQAEIVATLYAAWNDFLIDGITPTDDALVAEVSKNWHPEKAKITEAQWRAALPWMRDHRLVPTGYGQHTKPGTAHGGRA